jgi:hypothetical protein
VVAALVELGRPADPQDVAEKLRRIHGGDDLSSVSMQDLIEVLGEFQVPTTAVRFEPADVDRVPLPAILYTSPRMRSEFLGTGHFALLIDVRDDHATIIDLTLAGENRPDGLVKVHKGRLRNVWRGAAVLLSNAGLGIGSLVTTSNLALSAITLSALLGAMCLNIRRKRVS